MLKVDIKRTLSDFKLDVSLCIDHDLLVILGPSGSGKTMTLQCIAGLILPDEGNIELNGKTLFDAVQGINLPAQQRRIGFVFQNYALFPHLTVWENISYGVRHLGRPEATTRVNQLLEIMHVGGLEHRYPRQLSAGQQQRVAIARALAPDPDVLLLDEPFSALDTQLRERLELELLALHGSYRGSMLLVTHDLVEGYKLGSRTAIFQSGSVIQCDTRQKVFSAPANRTVARLTGVRNLMDGIVTHWQDASVWVKIPAWGIELKVAAPGPIDVAAGQAVTLGIRSEYISLAGEMTENSLPGIVLQAAESISTMTYRFQASCDTNGKHLLNAIIPKSEGICLPEGRLCRLGLPPEHLIIIPE
jgi:molybdate transport system ATP-binding protein